MKKYLLAAFILVDVSLIVGSGFFLFTYISHKVSAKVPFAAPRSANMVMMPIRQPAISTMTALAVGNPLNVPAVPADSSTRKILFSYRNPHARQVSIRADFTGWKAEAMEKAANGNWTYLAHLTPGEYAYCYTADDKTFKDPANKRTKQIGRTMVSSILVEPLPSKPPK